MTKPNNLYNELRAINLLAPIKQELMNGSLKMGVDGKIVRNLTVVPNKPWANASFCQNRDCDFWMDVMFKHYHIIPEGCRNCWKLSMKPKTLKELFAVQAFQASMPEHPAKCGIERRGYTGNKGGYAAFWYCDLYGGLKDAREHHRLISTKLDANFPDHGLVIKRGCTEMEHFTRHQGRGGSEDWDKDAEYYNEKEPMIEALFVTPGLEEMRKCSPPWHITNETMQLWIEHAYEHGDLTYLEYNGGESLAPPINLYHDSNHKHYNYKSTLIKETDSDNTSDSECTDGADHQFIKSDAGSDSNRERLSVV